MLRYGKRGRGERVCGSEGKALMGEGGSGRGNGAERDEGGGSHDGVVG
jgi:hypothetical protein